MCICPVENGKAANSFIANVFESCLYTGVDYASFVIGWIGILVWFGAHMPQLRIGFLLRNSDGLALGFILFWIAGDICAISSSFLTNQLITQKALGIYYIVMNGACFVQWCLFSGKCRCCRNGTKKVVTKNPSNSIISESPIQAIPPQDGSEGIKKNSEKARTQSDRGSSKLARRSTARGSLARMSERLRTKSNLNGSVISHPDISALIRDRNQSIEIIKQTARDQAKLLITGQIGSYTQGSLIAATPSIMLTTPDDADEIKLDEIDQQRQAKREAEAKSKALACSTGGIIHVVLYVVLIILFVIMTVLYVNEKNKSSTTMCTEPVSEGPAFIAGVVLSWLMMILYTAAGPIAVIRALKQKDGWNKSPLFFGCAAIGNTLNLISNALPLSSVMEFVWRLSYLLSNIFSATFHYISLSLIFYYRKYPGGKKLAQSAGIQGFNPIAEYEDSQTHDNEDLPPIVSTTELAGARHSVLAKETNQLRNVEDEGSYSWTYSTVSDENAANGPTISGEKSAASSKTNTTTTAETNSTSAHSSSSSSSK